MESTVRRRKFHQHMSPIKLYHADLCTYIIQNQLCTWWLRTVIFSVGRGWWAWYCGMAQFASIFKFLVFLLWHWLTMMHSTNMMPYMSCMSLCNRSHSMLDFLLSPYCLQCLEYKQMTYDPANPWGDLNTTSCALHNTCLSHFPFQRQV